MAWSVQQTELLLKLMSESFSAARIAECVSKIGDKVTRNGVIGKMHRMGYSRSPLAQGPRRTRAEQARDNSTKMSIMRNEAKAAELPRRPPNVPKEPPKRPAFRGLTLLELEHRDCRWPAGDRVITFCGAPRDMETDPACPYCAYHRKIAMSLPTVRRIRPAA